MKNIIYSIPVLLTVVFVVLKLTSVIAWSWWWVCSPILLTFAAVAILLIGALCFALYYSKEFKKNTTK